MHPIARHISNGGISHVSPRYPIGQSHMAEKIPVLMHLPPT